MAFTTEQVNNNFGKVLDHLAATATPNDGGTTAATVEVLRDIISNSPELQKQLVEGVNQKTKKVEKVVIPQSLVKHEVPEVNHEPQEAQAIQ